MKCPICGLNNLKTINSRVTKSGNQTWRRKQCSSCAVVITTYEKPNLSWLTIQDSFRSHQEPYRRFLLAISIVEAFRDKNEDMDQLEAIVDTVENNLIKQRKTIVTKPELIATVLKTLKPIDINAYMSYMAKHTTPHNQRELARMIKEL